MKSELHLNQDGIATGDGTATLPVKDLFRQIIDEAKPSVILTVGTSGGVKHEHDLGDVVVTRGAKFRLSDEFAKEPFAGGLHERLEDPDEALQGRGGADGAPRGRAEGARVRAAHEALRLRRPAAQERRRTRRRSTSTTAPTCPSSTRS